jgi:hypothetical protein
VSARTPVAGNTGSVRGEKANAPARNTEAEKTMPKTLFIEGSGPRMETDACRANRN